MAMTTAAAVLPVSYHRHPVNGSIVDLCYADLLVVRGAEGTTDDCDCDSIREAYCRNCLEHESSLLLVLRSDSLLTGFPVVPKHVSTVFQPAI